MLYCQAHKFVSIMLSFLTLNVLDNVSCVLKKINPSSWFALNLNYSEMYETNYCQNINAMKSRINFIDIIAIYMG